MQFIHSMLDVNPFQHFVVKWRKQSFFWRKGKKIASPHLCTMCFLPNISSSKGSGYIDCTLEVLCHKAGPLRNTTRHTTHRPLKKLLLFLSRLVLNFSQPVVFYRKAKPLSLKGTFKKTFSLHKGREPCVPREKRLLRLAKCVLSEKWSVKYKISHTTKGVLQTPGTTPLQK